MNSCSQKSIQNRQRKKNTKERKLTKIKKKKKILTKKVASQSNQKMEYQAGWKIYK